MDRINSIGTIEIDGKRMFFDGDPHAGPSKPATVLSATWFNSVQEEICNAVTSQGLSLNEGNFTQLKEALELSSYRVQICTHLKAMTDCVRNISSEVSLPEVTLNSNIIEIVSLLIDALKHISSEVETPEKPVNPTDINSIAQAINALIPAVNNLSERNLYLLQLPLKGV